MHPASRDAQPLTTSPASTTTRSSVRWPPLLSGQPTVSPRLSVAPPSARRRHPRLLTLLLRRLRVLRAAAGRRKQLRKQQARRPLRRVTRTTRTTTSRARLRRRRSTTATAKNEMRHFGQIVLGSRTCLTSATMTEQEQRGSNRQHVPDDLESVSGPSQQMKTRERSFIGEALGVAGTGCMS